MFIVYDDCVVVAVVPEVSGLCRRAWLSRYPEPEAASAC